MSEPLYSSSMFVDKVTVHIKAGDGGDGKLSFRHEKFIDKGGPDGGDGGDGGDVLLVASRNQDTLATFRYQKRLEAEAGQPGLKQRKHGKSGQDLVVSVPIGTTVLTPEGEVLSDLVADGQQVIIAKGGKGGFGNAHFVSSTRQAPRVAEKGELGDDLTVNFELKMIADVGLIGLPNAGKSSLLSVISNAHPEVANYPFTTLRPQLGMVTVDDKTSLLVADIPGLIEGASHGKGLGDEFLRHVERTAVLVHLIDTYNEDIESAYKTIQKELKDYEVDLSHRPQIVALSKIDGREEKIVKQQLKQLQKLVPKGTPVMAISAHSRENVDSLLYLVAEMVQKEKRRKQKRIANQPKVPIITLPAKENAWQIEKTDQGFMVTGRKIERFAQRTDFSDYHAVQRLRDIMRKMGIMKELERQGIEPGQKITVSNQASQTIEY